MLPTRPLFETPLPLTLKHQMPRPRENPYPLPHHLNPASPLALLKTIKNKY